MSNAYKQVWDNEIYTDLAYYQDSAKWAAGIQDATSFEVEVERLPKATRYVLRLSAKFCKENPKLFPAFNAKALGRWGFQLIVEECKGRRFETFQDLAALSVTEPQPVYLEDDLVHTNASVRTLTLTELAALGAELEAEKGVKVVATFGMQHGDNVFTGLSSYRMETSEEVRVRLLMAEAIWTALKWSETQQKWAKLKATAQDLEITLATLKKLKASDGTMAPVVAELRAAQEQIEKLSGEVGKVGKG